MRILIASDKFKGSLDAQGACAAIASALHGHEIRISPIADGGEGTARAVGGALGGRWFEVPVRGPLGAPVTAGMSVARAGDGELLAVFEMSSASGLALLDEAGRDPWRASTFGTGQLLLAAADSGADRIVIGIGGSATNDGGAGMAQALGHRFLDAGGAEIDEIPERLDDVDSLFPDLAVLLPEIVVACDVSNGLLGEQGATRVYGPQKGVEPDQLERHERRLENFANIVAAEIGRDERDTPGAGAAGGLGFGLLSFCGARLRPGFELVAEVTGLARHVEWADVVITGEGSLDAQSLMGKGPVGVARMAKAAGRPVAAYCGVTDASPDLAEVFNGVFPLVDGEVTAEAARADAARCLKNRVAQSRSRIEEWAP